MTFDGHEFGLSAGVVTFTSVAGGGAVNAVCSSWSPTVITCDVPALPLGAARPTITTSTGAKVEAAGGTTWPDFTVTAPPPTISGLSPTSGTTGIFFTITGTGFGATKGTVTFCQYCGTPAQASADATILGWSETNVTGLVPAKMQNGGTTVTLKASTGTVMAGQVASGSATCPAPVLLTIGSAAANVGATAQTLSAQPVFQNGRTFVPLRFVSQSLGAQVTWNGATKEVTITQGSSQVVMTEGQTTYLANGVRGTLDAAPYLAGAGYTMVPIRFVSEALGDQVTWVAGTRQVIIVQPCTGAPLD